MKGTIHYVQWRHNVELFWHEDWMSETVEVECDNADDSDGNYLGYENLIKYPARGTECREDMGGPGGGVGYWERSPYIKAEDGRKLCTSCALGMNLELTFHQEKDEDGNDFNDPTIRLDTLEKIIAEDNEYHEVSGREKGGAS